MARTDSPETHNELSVAPYTVWAKVPEKRTPIKNLSITQWVEPEHFEYVMDASNLPTAKRAVAMYPDTYKIFDNSLGAWLA